MNDPDAPNTVELAPGVAVPASALRYRFSRSGGPGGQHVNKTSTRATLIVPLEALGDAMPGWAVRRIPRRYRTEEAVVISSSQSRSQSANRDDCLDRLRTIVTRAMRRPKRRRKTKPSRAAVERRLDEKKRRGQLKRGRRSDGGHD